MEQERVSLYGYLGICRELSGAEIISLAGAYQIYEKVERKENTDIGRNRRRWARNVSEKIGYKTEEEVLRYEDSLTKQKLIYPKEVLGGNERGDWLPPGYEHRLTPLGINFTQTLAMGNEI